MMMKSILWGLWPMLLFLVITATPENSNANPLESPADQPIIPISTSDSDAEDAHVENPLAKGMTEIADNLIKVINRVKAGLYLTYYDEIIRELEVEVGRLPADLNEDRQAMLNRLYRSNTRIVTTRAELEQAARQLKAYTQELIDLYEEHDPSMRLLKYTAKKFNKYAAIVMDQLKDALKTYKETQDELSEAKASLTSFGYKLKNRRKELTGEEERRKRSVGNRKKRFVISGTIAAVAGIALVAGGVAAGVVAHVLLTKEGYEELVQRIETVQGRLNKLIEENNNIQEYVTDEIVLIGDWKTKLQAAVNDNHHDLTEDDIFFSIKHIKGRLIQLKEACDRYLEHILPNALQTIGTGE